MGQQIWVSYKLNNNWIRKTFEVKNENLIQKRLKRLANKYVNKPKIEIGYYVFNDISKTWMSIYDVHFDNEIKIVKLS